MKRLILTVIALCSLGGCATAHLDTPAGFAAHEKDKVYDFRATDGEGVVLAVRSEKNDPHGDLGYWTSALDAQLRASGYAATAAYDVTSADGHDGKQIRYVFGDSGRQLVFWVSIFVTDRKVVVVEAAGDTDFFTPKSDQVEAAIATLELG